MSITTNVVLEPAVREFAEATANPPYLFDRPTEGSDGSARSLSDRPALSPEGILSPAPVVPQRGLALAAGPEAGG
jgi:hypothetical protein